MPSTSSTTSAPARTPLLHVCTPPLSEQPLAAETGWLTATYLLAQHAATELGIAIPRKEDLRSALARSWSTDVLNLLERDNRCDLEGVTLFILTEKIRVGRLAGPILAIGAGPAQLDDLARCAGVTSIIFVPRDAESLAGYLARHPDARTIDLREETVADAPPAEHAVRGAWFATRYDVLAQETLQSTSKPRYLGELNQRRCRYCGKSEPQASFRHKAHAFPEQIGNKALVDRLECDACNQHFARAVEDDYAKWTLPMRSMGRVSGKGIPSFKSRDQRMRIDANGPQLLQLRIGADDPRHRVDTDGQTFTLQLERQPYVPVGVFKCLVKMALAVMPEPEASACAHLKRWLLAPSHSPGSPPHQPLLLLEQVLPGPLPSDRVHYTLLRRHTDRNDCPYLVFVLQFSNVVHQVVLPMPEQDRALLEQGPFQLGVFPHTGATAAHEQMHGSAHTRTVDLSGTQAVADDLQSLSFRYTQVVAAEPPAA